MNYTPAFSAINKTTGFIGAGLLLFGCQQASEKELELPFRPNILVISCEDISPFLGVYGDPVAQTPRLDQLAAEGIKFTNMFANVGVCAPSRASLITGMYPTAIGANHMRNYSPDGPDYKYIPENIEVYEVVLPTGVKCFTEFLREEGYYCTNNSKTDYQFASPLTAWDEDGNEAHWQNRPEGKPFFSIFNLFVSHESQVWARGDLPLTVDPDKVPVPPYFPDDSIIRHDIAVMYSNIHEMDRQAERLIKQVEDAGLLDSTIIIFYSDHGGPLPRQKRSIKESGTLVPFIVWYPNGFRKGETEERMASFVDVPATILSLAGIKPPEYMHGKAFLGKYSEDPREYVFGGRNRMDEQIDKQGFVRDERFRYIRNYYPDQVEFMPVTYRMQMPMMRRMLELYKKNELNEIQRIYFENIRGEEEFYDVLKDPHEINNLIDHPDYQGYISRLRNEFEKWDEEYNEMWHIPEIETREMFFPNDKQQIVKKPTFKLNNGNLSIESKTPGASIAYQINGEGHNPDHWFLYNGPVAINEDDKVTAIGVRAGFKNSNAAYHKEKNNYK
ncbi:sulfatase family protein [Alkalitalea saponilacus]|uniref:Arylsulfatase A n=1 Tax=Alkalitalea saponilacus TaxID=889453 RepID=A0A1T5HMP4_9BACT|nr:sulfatase [Alkalitalea saponilacus]ASB49387.1 sulfatase [Alkalitalea saponilacus]SKC21922.1 Arylsulfatase A [Alkalitalea saponilacus]